MVAYEIISNRILPKGWKEVRKDENKRGFKTHSKCWGAIRACFGTAIKWEIAKDKIIYINTASAKHWWKSNSAFREDLGIRENFSKKAFKALLNRNIQANITSDDIRRAGQIQPLPADATNPNPLTLKENNPIETPIEQTPSSDEEILKKIYEDCEKLLTTQRSEENRNTETFNTELQKLEGRVVELKEWLNMSNTPEFSEFVKSQSSFKKGLELEIRKLRDSEIEKLSEDIQSKLDALKIEDKEIIESINKAAATSNIDENDQFLKDHDLVLPTFKDSDSETEKLMQYRWLLMQLPQIASTKLEKKIGELKDKLIEAFKQGNLTEAKDIAEKISELVTEGQIRDDFKEVRNILRHLIYYFEKEPQVLTIDLTQAKEKLDKTIQQILVYKQKYQKYKTPSFLNKTLEILNILTKFRDNFSIHADYKKSLQESMTNLGKYLPKEILNLDKKALYAEIIKKDIQEVLNEEMLNGLRTLSRECIEENNNQYDKVFKGIDLSSLDEKTGQDLKEKLLKSKNILNEDEDDLKLNAKREELQKIYPKHFEKFDEIDPSIDPSILEAIQEIQLRKTFLQILSETETLIKESIAKEAESLISRSEAVKAWKFDPEKDFSSPYKKYTKLQEDIKAFTEKFGSFVDKKALEIPKEVDREYASTNELFKEFTDIRLKDVIQPGEEDSVREKLQTVTEDWLKELEEFKEEKNEPLFIAFRKAVSDLQEYAVEKIKDQKALIPSLNDPLLQGKLYQNTRDQFFPISRNTFAPETPQGQLMQKYSDFSVIRNLATNKEAREKLTKEIFLQILEKRANERINFIIKTIADDEEYSPEDRQLTASSMQDTLSALLSNKSLKEIWEVLNANYPDTFGEYKEVKDAQIDRLNQIEEWMKAFVSELHKEE